MLLQLQRPLVLDALLRRPSQPWLWLSPCAHSHQPLGVTSLGRGLQLHRCGAGYAGDLCCALPLPFATESLRAIVVEHAMIEPTEAFLGECARVLMPGGQLYAFTLNGLSPYRVRWLGQAHSGVRPSRWRALVQHAGLHSLGRERYLGPVWRATAEASTNAAAPWRAVCLLQAEKRALAAVPPAPVAVRWRQPAITI